MSAAPVETFDAHRGLLFSVAYRILGSVAQAEDAVQESWLRWDRADRSEVADPRAYLVKIVTRAAIDQRRGARAEREVYVGSWLPEPLLAERAPDVADDAARADEVSMAMLVVLETLSPLERSVFVLREAFGFGYAEIGDIIGRGEAAVRQLAHRAREHVRARRPRFEPDRKVRREATERFLAAALGGDLNALMETLAPDVTLWTDTGGKVRAPRRPIRGADKVSKAMERGMRTAPAGLTMRIVEANGGPALALLDGERTVSIVFLEVLPESHLIGELHVIANPDKLARVTLG
ncbi:RNA polymerase sigma-70 factor [Spongiactinospora sp. TRM90649]|uniref:RNA polymerase sigma-70 factor n=1 Tax=Spongiactinospora sp. TRM90649 TaxID=3031114 RepID=UPI0023F6F381|nr:RNA polymerase sigma-70 factor [Spongiactinospora sp. TRM90649]MDF5755610.1 RNA polymerase sigma-70 factor [Spongiactinospora sp. TRM90649]